MNVSSSEIVPYTDVAKEQAKREHEDPNGDEGPPAKKLKKEKEKNMKKICPWEDQMKFMQKEVAEFAEKCTKKRLRDRHDEEKKEKT